MDDTALKVGKSYKNNIKIRLFHHGISELNQYFKNSHEYWVDIDKRIIFLVVNAKRIVYDNQVEYKVLYDNKIYFIQLGDPSVESMFQYNQLECII